MRPEVGSRVELRIESLAAQGDGVGRLEGCVVFVPYTVPGDRIRAELVRVRPRYARGELLDVLEPGPHRRESPCPYFASCGGCRWLHLDEAGQEAGRIAILREALGRIGRVQELPSVEFVRSPAALGYRSRARVAHARGQVGFRAWRSHEVVDIERCLVLDPETQRKLIRLREKPPRGRGEIEIRGYGKEVEVAGRRLVISPGAFFQANRTLWDRWFEVVVGACGSGELAVELYAGVGFFTVGIEQSFKTVIAVERGSSARDARRNTRASVIEAAAERWLPEQVGRLEPNLVLLNPPRVGCDARVIDPLRELSPPRIVYVSCEPSTLARDISRLRPAYRLTGLFLLDALPQTHHVEAVAKLEHVDIASPTRVELKSAGG